MPIEKIEPVDTTRLLWLCYVHGGAHPDLSDAAVKSLRKFPEFVQITEPDENLFRPQYRGQLSEHGREYCDWLMSIPSPTGTVKALVLTSAEQDREREVVLAHDFMKR